MNPPMKELQDLRQTIDDIDDHIVESIARRFKITREIGRLKADQRSPALDKERENEILSRLSVKSESLSLSPELIRSIFRAILSEAVSDHQKISQ